MTAAVFAPGTHPLENPIIKSIYAIAGSAGLRAYLVGGYIRDNVLVSPAGEHGLPAASRSGSSKLKNIKDYDFAITKDGKRESRFALPAIELARIVAEKLDNAHFVLLDESNDIARVVLDGDTNDADEMIGPLTYLDFAGCAGSIEEDIQRRDFTINAIVYDEEQDTLLDPTGGLSDLATGTVRAVSEAVLVDDPLRVLRAYRFAGKLNGTIEPVTRGYLRRHAQLLDNVARERISHEFFTMMEYDRVAPLIVEMGEIGLLEVIYPELRDCRRVTANSFHHLALFDHSVETIPQIEERWHLLPDWVKQSADRELAGGISRRAAAKVAALLHDIGKPDTWEITPEGRHTFIGHDKLGAEMIRPLADREKWSRTLTRFVERLVLWHLRPGHLFHTGTPTQKALNRFYRTVGEEVPELMILAFADFGATCGPGLAGEDRDRLERCMIELMNGYPIYIEASKRMPKLLDGQDVMRIRGIKPGPLIGEILNSLTEAQEIKEVTDAAQAEAFVRNYQSPENR